MLFLLFLASYFAPLIANVRSVPNDKNGAKGILVAFALKEKNFIRINIIADKEAKEKAYNEF